MPNMRLKDGSLSAYALGCGYIDVMTRDTESGRQLEIRLSYNGCAYDVELGGSAFTYHEWGRMELPSGAKIAPGWVQFDRLSDARKYQRHLASARNLQTVGGVVATMYVTNVTREVN